MFLGVKAVIADPQTRARDMVIEVAHPTAGSLATLGGGGARSGSEGGCMLKDSPSVTAEERPNKGPDELEEELLIKSHFRQ